MTLQGEARPDAAAVLLVGGRSSRMGRPKAGLLFDGEPLLAHLLRRLARAFPAIVVVRAPGQDLAIPSASVIGASSLVVAEDRVTDQGPVAGICAGLAAVRQPLAYVVTCDVPFLDPGLGVWMVSLVEGYDVVVPEWEGRLNPLQAVYRTRVLPVVEAQLAEGRRRLMDLYERVAVRKVSEAEIRAHDPEGRTFFNMNTPEEYERALSLWGAQPPPA
jgi:molybdopterin-guanine dinucleotide biosynthesis protein A